MALTNTQYEQLMRIYEQRQLDNEHQLRKRFLEVYDKIPKLQELDHTISELSLSQARKLLDGDNLALTALKKELHLLSAKKKKLLEDYNYPADYLALHYICLDCQDTGYIGNKKCHCFQKAIIDLLYTQSNLQEILKKENFGHHSFAYYSKNHIDPKTGRSSYDAAKKALQACHHFVDTFSDECQNILFYGDTGVGKTFLSHCIAKELLEKTHSVIYVTAAQLFDISAKNAFEKNADAGIAYNHIYDCDLLIIDDLGTEYSNSFKLSQLFICLNERILSKKSTIISTNLSLDDMRNIYSERIFSRISSHFTLLRLTGDDIRIQKKLMNKND